MNQQQDKIKSVVFFTEGIDLSQKASQDISLESLNKIIAEGNSTIIIDENKVTKEFPLISTLNFAKTLSEGPTYSGNIQEGTPKFFGSSSGGKTKQNDNDEEVIEVRYISHPKKFLEISDVAIFIVTTSSKIAEFCEIAEISYLYVKDQYNIEEIRKTLGDKKIDLLILHRQVTENQRAEALTWIENFLKAPSFDYDLLRLIFSSFNQTSDLRQIIQKHEEQLKDAKDDIQSAIKKIVPQQTWQYYRGKVTLQASDIVTAMLMVTNRKELNRADEIQSLSEYAQSDTLKKFGGKVIHTAGVLREILFELGKLPKFGA